MIHPPASTPTPCARGGVGIVAVIHIGWGDREIDRAPVDTKEDQGRADMEVDHDAFISCNYSPRKVTRAPYEEMQPPKEGERTSVNHSQKNNICWSLQEGQKASKRGRRIIEGNPGMIEGQNLGLIENRVHNSGCRVRFESIWLTRQPI